MIRLVLLDERSGLKRPAGIYDVCEWWIEGYPKDIFVTEPKEVIVIRNQMELILKKRKVSKVLL